MSSIELLKSGIETGDWQKVCAAYHALTGQSLNAPTAQPGGKQLAKKFRDQLHAAVDRVFTELVIGPTSKTEKRPIIVVPTQEEAEAILDQENPTQIELEPEDGLGCVDEDGIKPEDINGDGPTEPLREFVPEGSRNCYGDAMKVVTRDGPSDPNEVKRNKIRAQRAAARKQKRPEPTKYEAVCSGCERTFESLRKPTGGIGQKCPRCIRNMEKPER